MPRDDDNLWDLSFLQPRSLMSAARDWWTARSKKAAAIRDAERWVKELGQDRIDALFESVVLPDHLFSGVDTYSKEEADEARAILETLVVAAYSSEGFYRRDALVRKLLYMIRLRWSVETHHSRVEAYIARREAYRADYAARLQSAAAANPTTAENRRAYAQQAFLNTGKYLTNTGRELTPSERKQLGLPSNK